MDAPRRLANRYELLRVLGRGGMATVHLCLDTRLGREVAVKTLLPELARDPVCQARFQREAESAASLNHPAVVAVYDTGEELTDGVPIPYIVMEYVEGATLRQRLTGSGSPPPERALEICSGVLRALAYSHARGIVHRDIKPANIMLTDAGEVKVMDFGIARATGRVGITMEHPTSVLGTAEYLSPEQARGETVDARSDLYSTGCLLNELLTGRPPFTGDSPVAVAYQHVNEAPAPPSSHAPDIAPGLREAVDAIVLRALAKDPDERYATADAMRHDLHAALTGAPLEHPAGPAGADATSTTDTTETSRLPRQAPPHAAAEPATAEPATAEPAPSPTRTQHTPRTPSGPRAPGRRRREPRRRGRAVLAAVVTLALVVGAVLLGRSLVGGGQAAADGGPDLVSVPDLGGMSVERARATAEEAGLTPREGASRPCPVPEGRVCATDPAAGTDVEAGSTLTLVLSAGSRPVRVPDVVGDDVESATAELWDAGFEVAREAAPAEVSATAEPGTVVDQDPPGGRTREPGTTVTLTVAGPPEESASATPEPSATEEADGEEETDEESPDPSPSDEEPQQVPVPDVTGLPYEDAERTLREAGLTAERVTATEPTGAAPDTVIAQDPADGTLPPGGLVTLTVEPAVAEVEVPTVDGLSYADAEQQLTDAGLVPLPENLDDPSAGCAPQDVVDSTDPAGGTTLPEGETVTVFCVTAP
ncbi:Stk1 family PASTA domain-containing Ser/Thr kinase [Streptomyces sp. 4N509B]|uniref:Stk1 family PASTA domain-containing Ser/Thr kinase n=1 Tax=Streptomyces sp. 4N509B TaxID=3457413 RepID=UPI003FD36CD1